MISWKEYIKSDILEFRRRYNSLSEEIREFIKESIPMGAVVSLTKPSQVVVIDIDEALGKYFLVLHSKRHPDMEIEVYESLTFENLSHIVSKEKPRWLELVNIREIESLAEFSIKRKTEWFHRYFENAVLIGLAWDPRVSGVTLSDHLYKHLDEYVQRETRRKKIAETVDNIKRDAREIPVMELRTKIMEATERLEGQVKQLDKKLREEVSGVRRMIGTSEKYLDWKAFTSDFEHLKETHITREAFEAHVKRLDEKIDKGLDALNTRIEDLKAIKFWSKRTLLEIALAIWGTIVTLYAAGILKF